MRHLIAWAFIVAGFGGMLTIYAMPAAASEHQAYLLVLDDAIDSPSANLLSRAIRDAEAAGAQMLIVQLNTPGGLLASTRDIVEAMFGASMPVVVYVSPSGAQAASAGAFVTAAAHIAAMAPATNIGAASPVGAGGEDLPDTIRSKATEDAAAFLRSIAAQRGRNAEALEACVLDAASYTADEALELGIVDLTANDIPDLLTQLDGMTVSVNGDQLTLQTQSIGVARIQPTLVERFIDFIANPNIAFLLLTIGGICILVEVLSPGLLGPGAVGVIALALAFLAFGNLPVNWVGVGLIILAMGLFFAEAQAPGVGIFGVSGAAAFVLGAFLLFGNFSFTPSPPPLPDAPDFRISLPIIGAVSLVMFAAMLFTLKAVRDAKKARAYAGATSYSNLMGQQGRTATALDPLGSVQIGNERWTAEAETGERIPAGVDVIVVEVDGLRLKVSRADGAADADREGG